MPKTMKLALADKIERAILKTIKPVKVKKSNKEEWLQVVACLKLISEQISDRVAKV